MSEQNYSDKTGRHLLNSPAGRFLLKLAVFALLLGGFFLFVTEIRIQRGNRMYPFIMDGDVAVIWKPGLAGKGMSWLTGILTPVKKRFPGSLLSENTPSV